MYKADQEVLSLVQLKNQPETAPVQSIVFWVNTREIIFGKISTGESLLQVVDAITKCKKMIDGPPWER